MIDFWSDAAESGFLIFGAAGQFGIFITLLLALALVSGADRLFHRYYRRFAMGQPAIYVASKFAIELFRQSLLLRIPICRWCPSFNPPIMRALTTKKERANLNASRREESVQNG